MDLIHPNNSGKIPAKFGKRTTKTVNKMDVLLTGKPSKVNPRSIRKKIIVEAIIHGRN